MAAGSHSLNVTLRRIAVLFALVLAGEIIFSLPFHVARFFRPTFLSVFDLSNTQLGDVFAVYGVTATLVYFPGGVLADLVSARKLMAISLLATALGGVYLAQIPGPLGLGLLFAYWGVTSIFLFWAALIKATREWGGEFAQGSAFGLLDGGRGLLAALLASLAVVLLTTMLPADLSLATASERRRALQDVIYFYAIATAMAALVVWWLVPEPEKYTAVAPAGGRRDIVAVIASKDVWLQAVIVICAYCAYKSLDNFALYAVDALAMNELDAARFTSQAAYLRPLSAIAAGFLANRISSTSTVLIAFILLVVSYFVLANFQSSAAVTSMVYANIGVTFCAVYALRGVYFALLGESSVPAAQTGAAVGVISLVGFTPDIFFAPVAGRILDASPGASGHQNVFLLLVVLSIVGLVAVAVLKHRIASMANTNH